MAMTPEERIDLIEKISARLPDLDDLDLMTIATQNGVHVESAAERMTKDGPAVIPPIIDTSILTGSVDGLKNFLIKKSRDKDSQS